MRTKLERFERGHKLREWQRELSIEARTTDKGLCFICGKPRQNYPDGVLSMTCLSEPCRIAYIPGGKSDG